MGVTKWPTQACIIPAINLPQASARGRLGLGTCVAGDSHMYPWLFQCWDCSQMGGNNVDGVRLDDCCKKTS